jgi:hypothetical protein
MSNVKDLQKTSGNSGGHALKLDARPFIPQQTQDQGTGLKVPSNINAREFFPSVSNPTSNASFLGKAGANGAYFMRPETCKITHGGDNFPVQGISLGRSSTVIYQGFCGLR